MIGRKYAIEVEGVTPLLMHWDNLEWADKMDEWKAESANKAKSKAGDDRSPAWRWIGSLYTDGSIVALPADVLSSCLMNAGAMVPTGKGQKTFKAQAVSGMRVAEPFVPLLVGGRTIPVAPIYELQSEASFPAHRKAAEKMGFALWAKRARIGQQKHIRVRPRFDQWALAFLILVWDEQITGKVLGDILACAGAYKGLCDWRPGSRTPGSFGCFSVRSLKLC